MTFSRKILAGLAAGIAAGLLLGELVAPLQIVADGFIRLLQMTVLPYVTISIISSLGSLSLAQARALGVRGGAVLLAIWVIVFGFTCLMPLVFPRAESASFFSSTLVERPPPFDFVDLYIPANPFNALANSVVPAVVLFSVVIGVALIGVDRKQTLLDVLEVASTVVARATRAVLRLTPYGLFAIAAVTAGTLSIDQLHKIQIFLVTYVSIALLVALWVLPGLVSALTGIPIRALFSRTRNSLILAFAAGDLFIVLPALIEACKDLLARPPADASDAEAMPDVIVPVSFNFPHAGKLLSLGFIPFAAWFSDASLRLADYPQLFVAGLLSFFGSLNSAVPFLLNLFRLPADTFRLFIATGVINSRFGTLVAAMHTIAIAILGSLALTGGIRWNARRLVRYAVLTAAISAVVTGGLRIVCGTVLSEPFAGADIVYGMRSLYGGAPARAQASPPPPDPASVSESAGVIDNIHARGVLRVAVLPDRMPFAFPNRDGVLVGLDVEMAQALAASLGVRAEFFEIETDALHDVMMRGACDIAMSGVAVTSDRAATVVFSTPYLDETLSFVMLDHLRDRFRTWESIRALGRVRIMIPDLPPYREAMRTHAPEAELLLLRRLEDLFNSRTGALAYVLPAERGSVLTLLHPEYSVVVPEGETIKLPVAYPLARGDVRWATFVNTWVELKRRDGTLDALYRHWILGQDATTRTPRWSILRNVLHWVR
jgi:Na+/H+-dicarboxylate symporter/ABC-type amino acid transport substrate-binding protein